MSKFPVLFIPEAEVKCDLNRGVQSILDSGMLTEDHLRLLLSLQAASDTSDRASSIEGDGDDQSDVDDSRRSEQPDEPNEIASSLADELALSLAPDGVQYGSSQQLPAVRSTAHVRKEEGPLMYFHDEAIKKGHSIASVSWTSALRFILPVMLGAFLAYFREVTVLWAGLIFVMSVWGTLYCGLIIRRHAHQRGVEHTLHQIEEYLKMADMLLCSVAEVLKYLQERETLTMNCQRFDQKVSIAIPLRKALHDSCVSIQGHVDDAILCVTRLVQCAHIEGFNPLNLLKDVDEDAEMEEEEDSSLSLRKLKACAHHLAVSNSKLLKHVAACLLPLPGSAGTTCKCIAPHLLDLCELYVKKQRQLKWHLKVEQLYTVETSFQNAKTGMRAVSTLDSLPENPAFHSLLNGLHGMDIRGQHLVHGIRDCEAIAKNKHLSEWEIVTELKVHLELLRSPITTLSHDLDIACNLIKEVLEFEDDDIASSCSNETESQASNMHPPNPTHVSSETPVDSDSSSEDEVYEMYVPAKLSDEEKQLSEDDTSMQPSGPEVQRMIDELKGLLTLRQNTKQKKKQSKLKAKPSPPTGSFAASEEKTVSVKPTPEMQSQQYSANSHCNELGSQGDQTVHYQSNCTDLHISKQYNPEMKVLAMLASSMAAKRLPSESEECFGDDDN